jgi:predicted nucleic acid-binding protein
LIVVDSSVWIHYFNGVSVPETDALDRMLGVEPILVGDLILAAVLQGFRTERDAKKALGVLDLMFFEPIGGRDTALLAAKTYRSLRAKGVTVRKTVSMLIASFCIIRGYDLLHADRDFDLIAAHSGLQLIRSGRRSQT